MSVLDNVTMILLKNLNDISISYFPIDFETNHFFKLCKMK